MASLSQLIDGLGRGFKAAVTLGNALHAAAIAPDVPTIGSSNVYRYFSQRLSSDGTPTGTTDMNVNGALGTQEFFIRAATDYDLYVTALIVIIADTSVVHNNFGNIDPATLTHGWDLKFTEDGVDTYLIDSAKTGGQVIAQAGFFWPFGDATDAWELVNWTGTTDAQIVNFPLGIIMSGLHSTELMGLRIGRGAQDRITSVIQDDFTDLTEFYVRALGFKHYPVEEVL